MLKLMLKLILILAPIQSFVLTNMVKGLTPSNVILILMLFKNILIFKRKFIKFFSIFLILFLLYFLISQLGILTSTNNIKLFDNVIFISIENIDSLEFRMSFLTQSIYLLVVVFFFYSLLLHMKKYGNSDIIKFSYIGINIFIVYGYIEFFGFLITGHSIDFLSNRISGEDFQQGLFQTSTIAGVTIQRLKSLAGEPSMFAYTVLPFFILSVYLKRFLYAIFLFFTLLVSTSTSAILGLVIWFMMDLIYRKNRLLKLGIFLLLSLTLTVIFYDIMHSLYSIIEVKLSLQDISGFDRFNNFFDHYEPWVHSNPINFLFGYGFGYARSTDALSTLLFNVGLIGLILYISFFTMPYFLIKTKTEYIKGLFIANVSLLVVMLLSVPEFYYPHIWLFNALLWYEYLKYKQKQKRIKIKL